MEAFNNIAGYQFAPLADLKTRRAELLRLCKERQLKGTILLSPEGINLFLAGREADVGVLLKEIRSWPGFQNFQCKESPSTHQPFNRMLVRIKKEIIAFGIPGIDPS